MSTERDIIFKMERSASPSGRKLVGASSRSPDITEVDPKTGKRVSIKRMQKNEAKTAFNLLILHEKNYVNQLGMAVNGYARSLGKAVVELGLNEELRIIFDPLMNIYLLHVNIWEVLETIYSAWPESSLGLYLTSVIPAIEETYSEYFMKLNSIISTYNSCTEFKKFNSTLKKTAKQNAPPLINIIKLPTTKLKQYQVDIQAILSVLTEGDEQKEQLQTSLEQLIQLPPKMQDIVKHTQMSEQIAKYEETITNLHEIDVTLDHPGREFINEGNLLLLSVETCEGSVARPPELEILPNIAVLFSDIALLLNENTFIWKIQLNDMEIDIKPQSPNCIDIIDGEYKYCFQCETEQDKSNWTRYFSETMHSLYTHKKVFGVDVWVLYEREQDVPSFLRVTGSWLLKYGLKKRGIFRENPRIVDRKKYEIMFDTGLQVTFPDNEEPNVVAGLIGLWVRKMPKPLMTFENYQRVVDILSQNDDELSIILPELKSVVDSLPLPYRVILEYLIRILVAIAQNEAENMMGPQNLALVLGPGILVSQKELDLNTIMQNPSIQEKPKQLVQLFIEHYDFIFGKIIKESDDLKNIREEKEARMSFSKSQKDILFSKAIEEAQNINNEVNVDQNARSLMMGGVVKQGWLRIKLKKWEKFWFVLKYKSLCYYKTPKSNLKENLVLKDCTVGNSLTKENCMLINIGPKFLLLQALNNDKDDWVTAIESCIEKEIEEFDIISESQSHDFDD